MLAPKQKSKIDQYLFNEAQSKNIITGGYWLYQYLTEIRPGKYITIVQDFSFDPFNLEKNNGCSINILDIPNSTKILGKEFRTEFKYTFNQGWANVEWDGHTFELVWALYSHEGIIWFIIGLDEKTAKDFIDSSIKAKDNPNQKILSYNGDAWVGDPTLYQSVQSSPSLDELTFEEGFLNQIRNDIHTFFSNKSQYDQFSVPWKRGLILAGTPGNGKSSLIKGLIKEMPYPCLYVRSFTQASGPDQYAIKEVFDQARRSAPCILIIEDIDSLITNKNRSFFLNEMDGFASNDGILTIATTNYPEKLDPAISNRPSRFDRIYRFDNPVKPQRRAYLEKWNKSIDASHRASKPVITKLVNGTENFSYAHLKELFISSLMAIAGNPDLSLDTVLPEQLRSIRTTIKDVMGDNIEIAMNDEWFEML